MAILNAAALLASAVLGVIQFFAVRAGAVSPAPDQPLGATWHMAHFLVGLFAAIFTLFVHCLIFTYFLGTGRWVREVARAYGLPDQDIPRQTREFKRRVFPPALFAMLSAIAAVASGAGVQTELWPWWSHLVVAALTLLVNGWAFMVEYQIVSANGQALDQVMAEVQRLQNANSPPAA